MRTQSIVVFTFVVFSFLHASSVLCAAPPSVADQCSSQFSKVGVCLSYATGKADTPSKECCATVKDIREKNPVCLCFIIQQVHDGSAAVKQMGLQEAKLLQLPTSCNLADAKVSDCPKLLNLSPSSPDYAIFNSTTTTTPATATPATGSSPPTAKDSSIGFMHKPLLASSLVIAITVALFISLFEV